MKNKWDRYFMDIALRTAELSKDPGSKVGAVIVGNNKEILAVGYNGFPMKVNDIEPARYERPTKYLFTEHAERNAIFHGARRGISLSGTKLYTTLFPCADCARAIIQVGIEEIYFLDGIEKTLKNVWEESFNAATTMLKEADVAFFQFKF